MNVDATVEMTNLKEELKAVLDKVVKEIKKERLTINCKKTKYIRGFLCSHWMSNRLTHAGYIICSLTPFYFVAEFHLDK